MSIDFGKGDLRFEQRLLACGGFYDGAFDGLWGPKSRAAAALAQDAYLKLQTVYGQADPRSEGNIATLLPKMQVKARQILQVVNPAGIATGLHAQILSGTRTYAEQDALFSQRPKVTNARGGQSNHNFGIAIDIGLFNEKGKYLTGATRAEEQAYVVLAQKVKAAVSGIEWGGDWKSFKDQPHYQYATGLTLAQTRAQFEAGKLLR